MDVGHLQGLWTFEQDDRPMGASSERGGLWKDPAIHKRRRKIRIGLSFDDNSAINQVITDSELLQTDIKVTGLASEIEQCRLSFREVDAELVSPRARTVHVVVCDRHCAATAERNMLWRGSQRSAIG
jgi:hypothetical protein